MALAGVLSAMREIILDAPELPEDQTARLKVFEKSFPQLTPSEREDLSKISPEKFGIYTTSIFVGEKNIIANNFPMTVKVLETYWPSDSEGKFSLFKLTKLLHKTKPWKSTASTALGKNFVEYIKENFPVVHESAPYLNQLASMEHAIRKIRKRPDGDFEAFTGCEVSLLSTLTVEQVMQLAYVIPASVSFHEFSFDLVGARSKFLAQDLKTIEAVSEGKHFTALSRNRDGYPRWAILGEKLSNFLSKQERDVPLAIEELAYEAISAHSENDSLSEEQQFVVFYKSFVELVDAGVAVVPRASA